MAEAFGILDYHNPGIFNGCRFSVRKYLYDQTDLINTVCDQIKCDKILKYCLGQRKGRDPKCLYKYKTLSCGSLGLLIYMLVRNIMIFISKPLISFEKNNGFPYVPSPKTPQTYWAISNLRDSPPHVRL